MTPHFLVTGAGFQVLTGAVAQNLNVMGHEPKRRLDVIKALISLMDLKQQVMNMKKELR